MRSLLTGCVVMVDTLDTHEPHSEADAKQQATPPTPSTIPSEIPQVDTEGEKEQLSLVQNELAGLAINGQEAKRNSLKIVHHGLHRLVENSKRRATPLLEKVDSEFAWKKLREPQLLRLFEDEGFEDPTTADSVVKYLEESLTSKFEETETPYHFTEKDTTLVRQLTEGIESPVKLLTYLSNIIDVSSAYRLPWLASYVERIKSAPHLQDFLTQVPTLGPLDRLVTYNYNESKSTYTKGLEEIPDPLGRLVSLPDSEYSRLMNRENLEWVRELNLSLLDIARKENPGSTYSILSFDVLPELLTIAANQEVRQMFHQVFIEQAAKKNHNWHKFKVDIVAFARVQEAYPEIVTLYKNGFAIDKLMTMYPAHEFDSFVNAYQYHEKQMRELANNETFLENARLLAEYGLRPDPFAYRGVDLGGKEWKSLYEFDQYKVLKKSLEASRHTTSPDERNDRDDGERKVRKIYQRIQEIQKTVMKYTNRFDIDTAISDSGEITSEGIDQLVETLIREQYFGIDVFEDLSLLLTNKAIQQMEPDQQAFWSFFKHFDKNSIHADILRSLLRRKMDGEYIINGIPSAHFIESLVEDDMGLLDKIDPFLSSKVLETFTPDDKNLWTTLKTLKSSKARELLYSHKQQSQQYTGDGRPTADFFQLVSQEATAGELVNIITVDMLPVIGVFAPNEQNMLQYWISLSPAVRQNLIQSLPNYPFVSEEEFSPYKKRLEIIQAIYNSPSREIKKLQNELANQLWEVDDPAATFAQVEEVFIKNNLPLIGKTYRVFETIYDSPTNKGQTLMESKLESSHASPALKGMSNRERRETIYVDLLKAHIESGNSSLKRYVEVLLSGQKLLDSLGEPDDISSLSEKEQQQLHYFLDKMDTLYINSLFGRTIEQHKQGRDPQNYHSPSTHELTLPERVKVLKKNFHVRNGQTLTDRVAEMFVYPVGYSSLGEVTQGMKVAKREADERNRKMVLQTGGKITVTEGDMLKGTDSVYLDNILQNGSVAKEFLGADSGSDRTPLDTDVARVSNASSDNDFREVIQSSLANGYGNIIFVIKNRGQFNGQDGYELFKTGVTGDTHYGIRTGFPSTEIDAIVVKEPTAQSLDTLGLSLARNGVYIPLVDLDGKVILSPEQFDEYRSVYAGIPEFSDEPMEVIPVEETIGVPEPVKQATKEKIASLVPQIQADERMIDQMNSAIHDKILGVLVARGIKLRDEFDTSIYGAELINTGSTGRYTNIPGDHDFDLSLLLDSQTMPSMEDIAIELRTELNPREDKSHPVSNTQYYQIISKGADIVDEAVDIDIGITNRSEVDYVASHDAVESKLAAIRERYGDETYYEVLANIVLAKQVLKEGHAYNKVDDGGFKGIGTENWVLQNKGNFLEACRTALKAAYANGEQVSFDEFKNSYTLFSAGVNLKSPEKSENFIANMTPEGYVKFIKTISNYLSVDSISD